MSLSAVLISEVGPRDGLQSVSSTMPTANKRAWISALHGAGLREIEVGSFVPARLLPQMADVAEMVAHARGLQGLTVMALVPNRRGAQAALDAGVHKLTVPVSVSAAHSLANVRKTREQMLDELRRIVALRNAQAPLVPVEVGLSTAFGCTLQGAVAEDDVVTENLVFMFEAMGVATGVDLHRLVAARQALLDGLPGEPLYGMTPEAGLPRGFSYADGRRPDTEALRAAAAARPP